MRFLSDKQEQIRFLKFSIVGVTGTFVDFGVMNMMSLLLNMPLVWAQGISFTIAVFNNFLWNRFWTYPESKTKGAPKQMLQFGLINIIGILIRTPLITWVNQTILSFLDSSSLVLPVENFVLSQNMALAFTIVIILFWNFFANRYWTYGNVPIGTENQALAKPKVTSNKR